MGYIDSASTGGGTGSTSDTNTVLTGVVLNPTGGAGGTPIYELTITDAITNAQSLLTAPASSASSDGTTTTVNIGDFSFDVCDVLNKFTSFQDEDGRSSTAGSCSDTQLLHRSLNANDQNTGSTGIAGLSVAAIDSDHSTTSGDGTGTGAVTTDHDSAVVSAQNSAVDGFYSAAIASRSTTTTAIASLSMGQHALVNLNRTVGVEPTAAGAQTVEVGFTDGLNNSDRSLLGGTRAGIADGDQNFNFSENSAIIDGTRNTMINAFNAIIGTGCNNSTMIGSGGHMFTDSPTGNQGTHGLLLASNGAVIKNSELTGIICNGQTGAGGGVTAHPDASIQTNNTSLYSYNEGKASLIASGLSNSIKSGSSAILNGDLNIIERTPDAQTTGTTYPTAPNLPTTCLGSLIGGNYRTRVAHSAVVAFTGYGNEGAEPIHQSTAHAQFTAAFDNGFRLYTNTQMSSGVELPRNATAWSTISDPEKKTNISPIENPLELIEAVDFYTFNYKDSAKKRKFLGKKVVGDSEIDEFESVDEDQLNAGVMADQWAKLGFGFADGKTVNYNDVIGVMGAALKEVIAKNKELEARIASIENA